MFYSQILYGCLNWQFTAQSNLDKLLILQKKFVRIITFSDFNAHTLPLFSKLKILMLRDVLQNEVIKFFFKFF